MADPGWVIAGWGARRLLLQKVRPLLTSAPMLVVAMLVLRRGLVGQVRQVVCLVCPVNSLVGLHQALYLQVHLALRR